WFRQSLPGPVSFRFSHHCHPFKVLILYLALITFRTPQRRLPAGLELAVQAHVPRRRLRRPVLDRFESAINSHSLLLRDRLLSVNAVALFLRRQFARLAFRLRTGAWFHFAFPRRVGQRVRAVLDLFRRVLTGGSFLVCFLPGPEL